MLNFEDYFPQGIAMGDAFIGREIETQWLIKNIKSGYHTLLLAPRRYGKTSLAFHALQELGLPYAEVDLHLAVSAKSVERKIFSAIQVLLQALIAKPEQLLINIRDFFKRAKIRWTLGLIGFAGIAITPDNTEEPPENILTALKMLEYILEKKRKRAVIFMDEIQEIDHLPEGKQIEGAIRHFAQKSKRLVFVFSGSSRRMLLHMFNDSSMPLYELCDKIVLSRIATESYKEYLNRVSKIYLHKKLPDAAFNKIMSLSDRHPKRTYNLCFYLWRICEKEGVAPNLEKVISAWELYLLSRLKDVRFNLSKLSNGQIKILTLIAIGHNVELTGKEAQRRVKMAGSSITSIIQFLEEHDYIEKDSKGFYIIIDPLIRDVLKKFECENIDNGVGS